MANSLNLNSAYYVIFRKLNDCLHYIIEIKKSGFANIRFREFDLSEPGCQIKFCVYFHPVECTCITYLSAPWSVTEAQYHHLGRTFTFLACYISRYLRYYFDHQRRFHGNSDLFQSLPKPSRLG